MQLLLELLEVSAYQPTAGYSLDLVRMAKAGMQKTDALLRWREMGRSDTSFYKSVKLLKDELTRLAFLGKKHAGQQGGRLDVQDKYKVVNQMLITGRKKAAVALAVDLVSMAQRRGMTEIVVGLSTMLEVHFGSIEMDARRYLRYRKIRKDAVQAYNDELGVKALQSLLVFSIEKNKDLKPLTSEIKELAEKKTGSLTFMRHRFTVLSVWYERKNNPDALIPLIRETIAYYEATSADLPSSAITSLYFRLTPILAGAGRYAEAEAHVSRALAGERAGGQNWHLLLLQRACLGIASGKMGMAQAAHKLAMAATVEHDNDKIRNGWDLVATLVDGKVVQDIWLEVFGV